MSFLVGEKTNCLLAWVEIINMEHSKWESMVDLPTLLSSLLVLNLTDGLLYLCSLSLSWNRFANRII